MFCFSDFPLKHQKHDNKIFWPIRYALIYFGLTRLSKYACACLYFETAEKYNFMSYVVA